MKFETPIEHEVNEDISLIIPNAYLDRHGNVMAQVQVWNGKIIHSDTLHTGKDTARSQFIKVVRKRATVDRLLLENALLLVDSNLSVKLNEEGEKTNNDGVQIGRPSQSTNLIELASDAELFHTSNRIAYARIQADDHWESWPVRSKEFRHWLMRQFYRQTGKSPNAQAIQDAIVMLEGKAFFDGQEYLVYTRMAESNGNIYLDLANDKWEAVEITKSGWQVVSDPPVKFRRPRGMLPLPRPVDNGSIADLRPFINIESHNDWVLLLAWLIQALNPKGPYPVCVLHGEQGSAKSTTTRILRALIDPNASPLRGGIRNEHELVIAAANGWCITLDNLSNLPLWLSDAICRIATGGGFSARELYSDADEVLFNVKRPVLLNGIEELATRGDLLDRSIILYLPNIPDNKRLQEEKFWEDFDLARPRILGALCNAMSSAIRNLPTLNLESLPRMADFARWVIAAEPELGLKKDDFINSYKGNRVSANLLALEASLIANSLFNLLKEKRALCDTATSILISLSEIADEATKRHGAWPKDGKSLSNKLRRLAPNLRAMGIEVKFGIREGHKGKRKIHLEWQDSSSSATSASTVENKDIEN